MADPWNFNPPPAPAPRPGTTGPYWSEWNKNQLKNFGRPDITPDDMNREYARQQQEAFIQQLHRLAQGDPNSLAQQQLRQSTQMAQGQVGGALAARGNLGGAGATMRQAGAVQGALGRQGMDQSRVLQMQEQAAAQQALAQALAAQRGQDVGQAGMLSDVALKNASLNDALYQNYFGQGLKYDVTRAQQDLEGARAELGFGLEGQRLDDRFNNWLAQGAAGASGAASRAWGNSNSNNGGFRTVDGKNSIVPEWDK